MNPSHLANMNQGNNWHPFQDRELEEKGDTTTGQRDMYRKGRMGIITPIEKAFHVQGQRRMP